MSNKIKKKLKNGLNFVKKKPEEAIFALLAGMALIFVLALFGNIADNSNYSAPGGKDSVDVSKFERNVKKMVSDSPMEKMVPYLALKNKKTAAYLVAIAKKESNFGKYSPKKRGKECFNYWGYKGTHNRNAAGYSCFDSPAQAVNIVGKRIDRLIAQNVDTPGEMVVWKCGSACTATSDPGAAKWVSDVALYYRKVYN